jgi:hypothetical protein
MQDNGLVMGVVKQAARKVFKHMTEAARDAGTFPLGQYGLNIYYCFNYIAPLHKDNDRSYTVSITTARSGDPNYYNFCFARWGIILHTYPGTIWYG